MGDCDLAGKTGDWPGNIDLVDEVMQVTVDWPGNMKDWLPSR